MGYQCGKLYELKATLTGSIDIVVCERMDSTLASTAFHVRFGKLKVLRTTKKQLLLYVNGVDSGLKMKLGSGGEGYFEYETNEDIHEDESELNAEGFNSDDEDDDIEDNGSDENQNHWFWGRFPKSSKAQKTKHPQIEAKKPLEDPPVKAPKASGFIRKIGEYFMRPKAIHMPKSGLENDDNPSDQRLLDDSETSNQQVNQIKETELENTTGKEEYTEITEEELERQRTEYEEELEEYNRDQVALSLCKIEINEQFSDIEVIRTFMRHKIDFNTFKDNFDEILKHPNLIIKIHDGLYNSDVGVPQIICLLAFNKTINMSMSEGVRKMEQEALSIKEANLAANHPDPGRNIPQDSMPVLKDGKSTSSKKR